MPKQKTIERARRAKRTGKAATTQAGEFVREEIRRIRRGKHGARSPEQAIAIGLSQARRAGVALAPPRKGTVKERTRRSAEYAYEVVQHKRRPKRRPRVARAVSGVMKKEPRGVASRAALSRHAKKAALRRKTSRRAAAAATMKSATKRLARPSAGSRKAGRTRKRRTR
jgi:hypothetical protein